MCLYPVIGGLDICYHAPMIRMPRPSEMLPEERITLAAGLVLNLMMLAATDIAASSDLFALNLLIIAMIMGVTVFCRHHGHAWVHAFRDWYTPAFLLVIFLENRRLIPLVNPHDLDALLIDIDRFIFFGHDPTVLLERITWPVLSEALQISYTSFYLLPLVLGVKVYATRPRREFHLCASIILMGFYLSCLGYYFMPAIGPRFTLAHVQTVPLDGLLLFDALRNMIAQIEGIMRDCCPSGHAMVSLLTVFLARRHAKGFFPWACIWAFLICFSTVYLRYHYVIDLVVGVILGLAVYLFGPAAAEALIRTGPHAATVKALQPPSG